MAIEVIAWVLRHSTAKGTDRLVLIGLADHADADDWIAWPSVDTLATYACTSRRSVQRALRSLEESGRVKPVALPPRAPAMRSDRTPVPYLIRNDDGASEWHPVDDGHGASPRPDGASSARGRGDTGDEDGASPVSPEPCVEPSLEPSKNRDAARGAAAADVDVVFAAWIEATGRTGQTVLTAKRRRVIVAALKVYPLDDVLDAVRGWRRSPFHTGQNDNRRAYNDLELLLRDAEHIEKFRDLERGADTQAPATQLPEAWQNLAEIRRRREEAAAAAGTPPPDDVEYREAP